MTDESSELLGILSKPAMAVYIEFLQADRAEERKSTDFREAFACPRWQAPSQISQDARGTQPSQP